MMQHLLIICIGEQLLREILIVQVERFLQLRCVCLSLLETFLEAKVPFMRFTDASEKQIFSVKPFLEVWNTNYYEKIKISRFWNDQKVSFERIVKRQIEKKPSVKRHLKMTSNDTSYVKLACL